MDALNRTNFFAYDPMGHLTNFTDTAGGTVRNTYDNVGNRLFSTNPNDHTTTNTFDALNRLSKTADPAGGVAQFGYDAVSNLINRKDPNGNTTTNLYDANNRRTKVTYPTGTPVTLGYDANGNRASMTDSLGTTIHAYDALNRLTSVTDCYGKTVGYGYDKNGNRISITYPGNKTVTYGYDAANRLKSVTDWLSNTTTYFYDMNGNLTNSVNPNGTAATYQYDQANRLLALTNSGVNSTIISSYQYSLDPIGNHARVTQTEQLQTTPVAGQSAYTYDNDSRQTVLDGQTQGFDANGNMISILNGTDSLAYDFENHLTQLIFVGDGGSTNTFQYNGAGNRMSANRSGTVTRYVLDVNSPLTQILAETDSGGNITAYYVYGLGLISKIDAAGNAQYYHYDSRGSTIALTDSSGQITDAYAYDPFGRPINNSGESTNYFRYLGRHGVFTEDGNFLYIRARYYSTKRGRFTTKDPTTGKDGDSQSLNRYIYALNNPVRLIDISGLSPLESTGQLNQNGTSDQQHQYLVENHHLTPEQAAKITQSQQEALKYELLAIHYEMEANILQGVYDALQTTSSLLTLDVPGVVGGLSQQFSTLFGITGNKTTSQVLGYVGTAGQIASAASGVYHAATSGLAIGSALTADGQNLFKDAGINAALLDAYNPVAQAYFDLVSPTENILLNMLPK
jgi:RHS repeat-associated protein